MQLDAPVWMNIEDFRNLCKRLRKPFHIGPERRDFGLQRGCRLRVGLPGRSAWGGWLDTVANRLVATRPGAANAGEGVIRGFISICNARIAGQTAHPIFLNRLVTFPRIWAQRVFTGGNEAPHERSPKTKCQLFYKFP